MQEVSSITPGNSIVSRTYGMACDMWHRDMGKDIQIREVTISKKYCETKSMVHTNIWQQSPYDWWRLVLGDMGTGSSMYLFTILHMCSPNQGKE